MNSTNHDLLEDAQSRIRALDLASFIVEAPAGAGKTELLTQRFLKLLQVVEAPEEIIAITFTNKAAAEMRLRILDSLQNAARGEKSSQPHKQKTFELSLLALQKSVEKDWRLLENPARLRIFTIDGLCAYLARQMPLMSRFGAQPSIADDPNLYYEQAAERTLALIEEAENSQIVIAALRYLDNDANQLKKLLIKMLSMRDQWLHHAQQVITSQELHQTLCNVVSEELAAIAKVLHLQMQDILMPLARFAASNVPDEHGLSVLRDWQTGLPIDAHSLPMWQAMADLLLTGKNELRKTITVKDGFPPEAKAQKQEFLAFLENIANINGVEEALARIRKLPKITNNEASWQIIATLSKLLNLAAAQLWLVFSAAREVDFSEVAHRATLALAGDADEPTELALRLDYQIKHLLVDEFQDTSPSQIGLLEKLTQGWQQGDGRTLFTVGDPMQSIYRFRKANVGLFLNAAQFGIGDVPLEKLRLNRNNRSCPPVVDWINQAFATIFPREDEVAKGAIAYRPFIATRDDDTDTGVHIHPVIKLPNEDAESAKKREAEAVVKIILQERQTYPNRKIAILVRAKSHLQPIVTLLRRFHKDLHFQAVEIEALSNRQIVQDLTALTRALHHRADRVSWLAVLRAPWCGLTLQDLHALAGREHKSTIWSLMQFEDLALTEDGKARLQHVRAVFAEAFAAQGRVNISRWVRGVWLMLSGASCLWEENDVIDVQAFFNCIEQLDRNNQFSLVRLEAEIAKLFAAPDTQGEFLQMMTIHKSKGLEFDTVILPSLGNVTGGNDDKAIVLWEDVSISNAEHSQEISLLAAPLIPKGARNKDEVTPYDYLSTLENTRANHEDARILYVAATRAERKLHLIGIANQNKDGEINPTKNTYLDVLWSALEPTFLSAELNDDAMNQQENALANFIPKLVRLEKPQMPAILQVDANAKQITRKITEEKIQQNYALEADIGTLTHKYLEIMANQGLENWSVERVLKLTQPMQSWFLQQGHAEKIAQNAAVQVRDLLITTLNSDQGRWVLTQHEAAKSELSLSKNEDGESQHFVIDRTFIAEKEGKKTRWVIDYKTIYLEKNSNSTHLKTVAEQYSAQLEKYAQLFKYKNFKYENLNHENLEIQKALFFVSIGQLVLIE